MRRLLPGRIRPARTRTAKKRIAAVRNADGQPVSQTVKRRNWRQRFGRKSAKGAPGMLDALLTAQALRARGKKSAATMASAALASKKKRLSNDPPRRASRRTDRPRPGRKNAA